MMSSLIKVFVYGTLKPGEVNHWVCAPYVVGTEAAIAVGGVYDLPFGYPAMTVEETGTVMGTLLTFVDPVILTILDEFEQHDPDVFHQVAPRQVLAASQYTRQAITVHTPKRSHEEMAWGYVMTLAQIRGLQGRRVSSGCWTHQETINR